MLKHAVYVQVVCLMIAGSLYAQEQGQPEGLPPSQEFAEAFLRNHDLKSLLVATNVCPDASRWHRSVLERIFAPGQVIGELVGVQAAALEGLLRRCEWPSANAWLQEALLLTPQYERAFDLLLVLGSHWVSEHKSAILRYAKIEEVDERAKTMALKTAWYRMSRDNERIAWFFEVYEADAMTAGLLEVGRSELPSGPSADSFATRGAEVLRAHPSLRLSVEVLDMIASTAALGRGVSRSAAASALRVLDEFSARGLEEPAQRWRAQVARRAGGG